MAAPRATTNRGSVVTCAWSGVLVRPAVAMAAPTNINSRTTTAATTATTPTGGVPTTDRIATMTPACTRFTSVIGSMSPLRMETSFADVERSRLKDRFWRREARVVVAVL